MAPLSQQAASAGIRDAYTASQVTQLISERIAREALQRIRQLYKELKSNPSRKETINVVDSVINSSGSTVRTNISEAPIDRTSPKQREQYNRDVDIVSQYVSQPERTQAKEDIAVELDDARYSIDPHGAIINKTRYFADLIATDKPPTKDQAIAIETVNQTSQLSVSIPELSHSESTAKESEGYDHNWNEIPNELASPTDGLLTDAQLDVISTLKETTGEGPDNINEQDRDAALESGEQTDNRFLRGNQSNVIGEIQLVYSAELFDVYKTGNEITVSEKGSPEVLFKYRYDSNSATVLEDNLTKDRPDLFAHFKRAHDNLQTMKNPNVKGNTRTVADLQRHPSRKLEAMALGGLAREGSVAIALAELKTSEREPKVSVIAEGNNKFWIERTRLIDEKGVEQPATLAVYQTIRDGESVAPRDQTLYTKDNAGNVIVTDVSADVKKANFKHLASAFNETNAELKKAAEAHRKRAEERRKPKLREDRER